MINIISKLFQFFFSDTLLQPILYWYHRNKYPNSIPSLSPISAPALGCVNHKIGVNQPVEWEGLIRLASITTLNQFYTFTGDQMMMDDSDEISRMLKNTKPLIHQSVLKISQSQIINNIKGCIIRLLICCLSAYLLIWFVIVTEQFSIPGKYYSSCWNVCFVLSQSKSKSKVQCQKDLEWLYSAVVPRFQMFNLAQIFTVDSPDQDKLF